MSAVTWGPTWHGEYANEGAGQKLTTADAHVLTSSDGIVALPTNPSHTRYVKRPGLAVPTTPSEVSAAGGVYLNDAVFCGRAKRFSPKSVKEFGAGNWLYFDGLGQAWKMYITSTTATISGTPNTPSSTPLTGTMTVNVWCGGRAWNLTPGWSAPAPRLVGSFDLTVRGWNRGGVWEPGSAIGRPGDVQERPDGKKALFVVAATGYSQTYEVDSTLIEIELSGDGSGEQGVGISASASVVWLRGKVVDYDFTEQALHTVLAWSLTSFSSTPTGPSVWSVTRQFSAVFVASGSPPLRYFQKSHTNDLASFGYLNDGTRTLTEFIAEDLWDDTGRYEPSGTPPTGTRLSTYTGTPAPSGTIGELWSDDEVRQPIGSPTFTDDPISFTQTGEAEFNAYSVRQTTFSLNNGGEIDKVINLQQTTGTLSSPIQTGFHGEWAVGIRYSNNVVGLLEFNTDGAFYGFAVRIRGRYGPDGSASGTMYPGVTINGILVGEDALYFGRSVAVSGTSVICAAWSPREGLTKTWIGGSVGTFV